MDFARRLASVSLFGALGCSGLAQAGYQVKPNHPRLLITDVSEVARRCEGPLADDYRVVKDRADAAVRQGHLEFISNKCSIPEDLMNRSLAYLIEREREVHENVMISQDDRALFASVCG